MAEKAIEWNEGREKGDAYTDHLREEIRRNVADEVRKVRTDVTPAKGSGKDRKEKVRLETEELEMEEESRKVSNDGGVNSKRKRRSPTCDEEREERCLWV
jgi:hypothetical protein